LYWMKIGIIGGTGDIGEGMSRRLSPMHEVVLGSRDAERRSSRVPVLSVY
jgi:8-hydroxy-5-deazaflavin:NADPH oxidoreductase